MVIGLLAITSIPTVIGVGQAISAQKRQAAAQSKEQEKFHLIAMVCLDGNDFQDACVCMLKDGRLYLNLPDFPVAGHRFCGYYFKYPGEEGHLGMVSTISEDPPMLNWIFVDAETHAVRHGGRKDTVGHVIGPWGWSEDERFLVLEGGFDKFIAVKEQAPTAAAEDEGGSPNGPPRWAVYWDPDGRRQAEAGTGDVLPLRLRRQPLLGIASRYVKD
ncbi:hypothetical protein S40293_03204 [Stachybotrys chartarum IBT 40293]|nr:hypothetical protein S40293_03204 [Stachybotrys chartarum IBT 40293]